MTDAKKGTGIILWLYGLALGFAFFGAVMVFSSSAFLTQDSFPYFFRQCVWIGVGLVLLHLFSQMDYVWILRLKWVGVIFVTVLLLLVLFSPLGVEVNGSRRWLRLAGIQIQPSEFAKYVIIVFLADILGRHQEELRRLSLPVLLQLGVCGGMALLIFIQPDRSMTLFILLCTFFLWVMAGARKRHWIPAVLIAVPLVCMGLRESRTVRWRFQAWREQDSPTSAAGYQIYQSKLGLACGGLMGLGLGRGRQKLHFLPFPHTDFIFSIVGEEAGFLGCLGLILGFMAFVFLGGKIAHSTHDLQASLLAGGVAFMVGLQAMINMGVTTGLLPPTGIALPFISYGGSSLVTCMAGTGILISIARSIRWG